MPVRGSGSLGMSHGPSRAAKKWWMVAILPLLGASSPQASLSTTFTMPPTATVWLVAGGFRHLVLLGTWLLGPPLACGELYTGF